VNGQPACVIGFLITAMSLLGCTDPTEPSGAGRTREALRQSSASNALTRSDVQAALIKLAESKGKPLSLTIPALQSGRIHYESGKEEGILDKIWTVDLSRRTFIIVGASDHEFLMWQGEFRNIDGVWVAVVDEESHGHR
jgi:hypothetical protein